MKSELKKKLPGFTSAQLDQLDSSVESVNNPAKFKGKATDQFMKHMDTSLESFFYQRKYTERNFTFYLQVLA